MLAVDRIRFGVSLTCALLRPVVKDLVDDGTSVFLCSGPVVWRRLILRLLERVCALLVVVGHLRRATRRKADLGLRWGQAAFGYKQLALTFLLGREVLFGVDIAVRL
jgi:hypothetical protein